MINDEHWYTVITVGIADFTHDFDSLVRGNTNREKYRKGTIFIETHKQ